MKLSNHTTSVLKNFSTINQNLLIKEGNTISTMSAGKNIVAKAELEETFSQEIAIYDLNEFLGALSLFSSPILDFNDNYVMISEEAKPTTKVKYFYLYSKLKKQVSTKISDGLQLIKRSSSATSAQFNDMSFEMGPPHHPFNKTGELNQSQTSLKSQTPSMA